MEVTLDLLLAYLVPRGRHERREPGRSATASVVQRLHLSLVRFEND